MKTSLILCLFVLIYQPLFSQNNFWRETKGAFFFMGQPDLQIAATLLEQEALKNNKIKSREKVYYSKGNSTIATEYFDQEGRVIKIEATRKKGIYGIEYTYNASGKVVKIVSKNPKGLERTTNLAYNDKHILIFKEFNSSAGKYNAFKSIYDENDQLQSQQIFEKDKTNPAKKLDYTYYEGGEKKTTTYTVKGKVKYVWNFECKQEGELLNKKHKDSSTICILKEFDADGNSITWVREFDEKGDLIKTQNTHSPEGVWLKTIRYNESDKLVSENFLKEDGGRKRTEYKKDGSIYNEFESFVDVNKQIIKEVHSSKKYSYTNLFYYKETIKLSDVRIGKKAISVLEYVYTYFS